MTLIVRSGAQTGADVAGLWAAKLFGIPTGGWAPKGFITLDGPHPEMATTFGIKEHPKTGYRARTIENLKKSDVTLVFSEKMSPGTKLTINECQKFNVPYFFFKLDPSNMEDSLNPDVPTSDCNFQWLINYLSRQIDLFDSFVINIAGNSTSNSPRTFEFTFKFCHKLFTELGYTSLVGASEWNTYKDKWEL